MTDLALDPVCLVHGKRRSEHDCLYWMLWRSRHAIRQGERETRAGSHVRRSLAPGSDRVTGQEHPAASIGNQPSAAQGRYYQAIIKVNPTDTSARQASDIADGIGYACALLLDEHGWSAERVADLLERVTDEVADSEAQRG